MRCPTLAELPAPPSGKTGWPWTEESQQLSDTPQQNGTPWPKVSIVTPSYNQGRFLEESIRSVLLQGYPDLEYIIIDGGSTDESVEIIKKYERWLTYWVSEPDRGQSHAINKGLEKSTGDLFNWQNADDILTPNSLAHTTAAMVQYPEVGYVHGYRIVIDHHANVLYDRKNIFGDKVAFVPDQLFSISGLSGGIQVGCLMRRDLVLEVGKIDEALHYVMDCDLILRLELTQPALYIPYPVIFLREYPEAKSLLWNADRAKERFIIARKIFGHQDLSPALLKVKRAAFATAHRFAWECYAKAGMKFQAIRHAFMDILLQPYDGWMQRRRIVKALAQQHSSLWLHRLYVAIKKMEGFASLFKSSD